MKTEEFIDLVFGGNNVIDPNKFTESDCDYFTCHECGSDMVNMSYNGKAFICVWCGNGCKGHGDLFLNNVEKLPKKVLEYLKNWKGNKIEI